MEKILPYVLATLTQHDRQKVVVGIDFEWSKDSWVHNCFRAFELVFWRKSGIRRESSSRAWKDEDGLLYEAHAFHTVEALLKFVEAKIRNSFKLLDVQISVPMLATPSGFPVFASPYLFAIAFNATGAGRTTATTVTVSSFSCATTNGLVVAGINSNTTYNFTGISAATDGAFTSINSVDQTSGNNIGLWYLVGITSASQNITATASTSAVHALNVASYSGVKQTGQPDASGTNTNASTDTYSQSLTSTADNCWFVWATFNGNISGGAVTAGANTTVRQNDASGGALCDTNGPKTPAGSLTMNLTKASADKWCSVMASFAPSVATTNSGFFRAALY